MNDHELFVPDVALGRLVETPEDITASISTYLTNNGLLDPSTASSALVTGADFMKDGAQGVAAALAANGVPSVDSSLISDSWTASDLTAKLFPASGPSPGIVSFNGHFDQTHMLTGDGKGVVDTSMLADPANADKLARRLVFSMGCHAGLSVSDVSIGVQLDWPQAITGTDQAGLYAANTGYGYGDDTSVALGERLVGLYAKALDGTVSVGRALMIAKQQYAASTEVLSPYDEKVLQESVFYGLPLYNLGSSIGQGTPPTGGPATSDVTISGTDPRTGLAVAPLDLSLTLPGAGSGAHNFHRNDTAHGSYFDVNGNTIQVQYRPIEPMAALDVTQADPTTGALTRKAHGLLVTDLTSVDLGGFTPDYFLPKLDQSANEQLLTPVGDAVFPSTLSKVTTAIGLQGTRQRRSSPPANSVTRGRTARGPSASSPTSVVWSSTRRRATPTTPRRRSCAVPARSSTAPRASPWSVTTPPAVWSCCSRGRAATARGKRLISRPRPSPTARRNGGAARRRHRPRSSSRSRRSTHQATWRSATTRFRTSWRTSS